MLHPIGMALATSFAILCPALFSGRSAPDTVRLPASFTLFSAMPDQRLGLWLVNARAPSCEGASFQLQVKGRVIAQSPPLAAGQGGLVRLRFGLAPGHHGVRIVSQTCRYAPQLIRRVVLGRSHADPGWRAPPQTPMAELKP